MATARWHRLRIGRPVTAFGLLSTYPPTRCGLATFTAALASALPGRGDPDSQVVRVDDLIPTGPPSPGPRTVIVGELHPGEAAGRSAAAIALSDCDVAIVQHEYGIYGGRDGDEILDVLARVTSPRIVVLHTVREAPSAYQRWLLDRVAGLASAVVVMTEAASETLARRYSVSPSKVHVIPHGVADPWRAAPSVRRSHDRPTVLSWGLLGPGKGVEWGIRALALQPAVEPAPRYVIAGQTHPKVAAEAGESYRDSLLALALELGVDADVEIDGRYRDAPELAALVLAADVVLLPYDSREQSTSGVLVEALAAGKPVIATRFPHAVELLSGGAGILVGHEDPQEIAVALHRVLQRGTRDTAGPRAPANSWEAVAAQYRGLAEGLVQAAAA
ncbi:MAG: glycosyltransferase [Microbacteriaceae bacterium]|nr:glycosyltransferase [Microbacteriaceae bacterium]